MPAATIIVLTAIVLMTLLLPLGVMLALRRRGGTWTAFLTGAGTFVLFAMVLEPILHNLILRSPAGAAPKQLPAGLPMDRIPRIILIRQQPLHHNPGPFHTPLMPRHRKPP